MQLPSVDKVFVYGSYNGSRVAPGGYTARLTYGSQIKEVGIQILPNPNLDYSVADFKDQQELLIKIETAIKSIHQSVTQMRNAQDQLKYYSTIINEKDSFTKLYDQAESIAEQLKNWEKELIQPNQKTFQDVINFNNKLNAELMHLKGYVDTDDPKVTQGAKDRYRDLNETWQKHKDELKKIIEDDFRSFEENYRAAKVPVLNVEIDSL